MATPIRGPSPQQPEPSQQKAAKQNTWTVQIQNIESLVQDGDRSGAAKQIDALISRLNAYQPQNTATRAAIQDLHTAKSKLQAGQPVGQVMADLEDARNWLSGI